MRRNTARMHTAAGGTTDGGNASVSGSIGSAAAGTGMGVGVGVGVGVDRTTGAGVCYCMNCESEIAVIQCLHARYSYLFKYIYIYVCIYLYGTILLSTCAYLPVYIVVSRSICSYCAAAVTVCSTRLSTSGTTSAYPIARTVGV